jgi:hypothetical protein
LLGKNDVASQAGNSVGVIDRHYRAPKHADDVATYWCRGWPAGERLLGKLGPQATEEWLKTPNSRMHGIPPIRLDIRAVETAIGTVVSRTV